MSGDLDHKMQELEDEIRQSRVTAWDVETFLVERHKAKIAEIGQPRGKWKARWFVVKEIADLVFIFCGKIAVLSLLGVGLLGL